MNNEKDPTPTPGLGNEKNKSPEKQSSLPSNGSDGQKQRGPYLRIFSYAGRYERSLQGIGSVAAAISGAGLALQNLIFGEFITVISAYISKSSSAHYFRGETAKLALYFVYLGIGRFVVSWIYNTLFTYASYRIVRNIRQSYLKAALSQEVAYYDVGTGGSIATQVTSNGRQIQGGISEKLGMSFQGIAAFFTAFALAFATNWKLTLISLCIVPATVIVMGVVSKLQAGYEIQIYMTLAQSNAFAEGVLSGSSIQAINAYRMQSRLLAKFNDYLNEAYRLGLQENYIFGLFFCTSYTTIYLGFALAFWQGVRMLAREEVQSPGDIFVVIMSMIIAATSLTSLAPYMLDFTRASAAAGQLFELIDKKSSIDSFDSSGHNPSYVAGELEFDGITFAYPTRPDATILENFSLKVPAGKVTAIVGQSGSGKSTLVGLIERWYEPGSGVIKLDGQPLSDLNINWLRRNVRLVQQESILFQGTVFDNIAYGLIGSPWENASYAEKLAHVQKAAKLAYAHDFVEGLSEGYNTDLGQRGSLLSGGQKQRISIARAIISQPKILLLDEATSGLDPKAEGIVQKAFDRASQGRTTIVIAHKLATIRRANNIVVMAKGKIVERGTHEGLIANGDVYARLVAIQDLEVANADENNEARDSFIAEEDLQDVSKSLIQDDTASAQSVSTKEDPKPAISGTPSDLSVVGVVAKLIKENTDLKWPYLVILLCCIGGSAVYPGQALLFANMMDVFQLQGSAMANGGDFFAAMFVVLAAGCTVFFFLNGYATNVVAQAFSHRFRKQMLGDILRQDIQFFDQPDNNTGMLADRIDSNPRAILDLMGFNIGLIVIAIFTITSCSILAIVHSWKLGLVVVLAGLPPLVGAGWLKIRLDIRLQNYLSKQESSSASIASEAVLAVRTVASLAIEKDVLQRYVGELDDINTKARKPLGVMMLCFAFTQAVEHWFMALGFWYGCRLVSYGETDMYSFFVAFLGVFFAGQATSQLFQFTTGMIKGKNAANYIFWLHSLKPEIRETDQNRLKGPKSGSPVEFDQTRFSYPLRPQAPVLSGLDLEIQKGQFVALVGASGCGKSTTISLLERFYDPSAGQIRIDGDDISQFNPHLYRQVISLVPQEPSLFQGTIRENVALGVDSAEAAITEPEKSTISVTDRDIEEALRAANAWDFVSSLPEGLETAVGLNGTQLSGGQRQRIAIARSLIRNPQILLLDEATSALDTESEKVVQGVLAEAAKQSDRITLAVAHRLSTIKDADLICVVDDGKIVERGTHQQLIAHRGMYHRMCEAQNLS